MPNEPGQPQDTGLLDAIENKVAQSSDEYRASLPEDQRLAYDIKVGVAKGTYGFTKSLISGLIDLTTFGMKLMSGDQEAYKKVGETAWGITKFVAKDWYYNSSFASPEEKMQYQKELNDKFEAIYQQVKASVVKDWNEAKSKGKEAELISKWATRGVLEIGSLFVGAGEVKAAAKASELSKTAEVVRAAEVGCDAEKAAEAAKAAELASNAKKAADAERLADTEKAAEAAKTAGKAAENLRLPGVTEAEIELAASSGQSPEIIAARKKVARRFYEQHHPSDWNSKTPKELRAEINSHLKGTDFTKPVKVRFSPPPDIDEPLSRIHAPWSTKGSYYAKPGTPATELGISPFAYNAKTGEYVPKVAENHTFPRSTPVLESSAAPIHAHWDLPQASSSKATLSPTASPLKVKLAEHAAHAKGGGTQYYIPGR